MGFTGSLHPAASHLLSWGAGVAFAPQGTFGNVCRHFSHHSWHLVGRGQEYYQAPPPTMHRRAPITKNYPAQVVSSTEGEKLPCQTSPSSCKEPGNMGDLNGLSGETPPAQGQGPSGWRDSSIHQPQSNLATQSAPNRPFVEMKHPGRATTASFQFKQQLLFNRCPRRGGR